MGIKFGELKWRNQTQTAVMRVTHLVEEAAEDLQVILDLAEIGQVQLASHLEVDVVLLPLKVNRTLVIGSNPF